MKRLLTLAATTLIFLLASCVSAPAWTYARDTIGTPMPLACRHDLSGEVSVPVYIMDRGLLDMTRTADQVALRQTINGKTFIIQGQPLFIQVAADLTGWRLEDTIHHEKCHVHCQLTRDPSCTGHFLPITAKNG